MNPEYAKLIDHIPPRKEYPTSQLQITLPTTSTVDPSEVIHIINDEALSLGWNAEDISVMKTSGYIACDDCKRTMHVHVATKAQILCLNCEGKNVKKTEADIRIVDN